MALKQNTTALTTVNDNVQELVGFMVSAGEKSVATSGDFFFVLAVVCYLVQMMRASSSKRA